MKVLGLIKSDLPTSAGWILEMKIEDRQKSIRILEHYPENLERHVIKRVGLKTLVFFLYF